MRGLGAVVREGGERRRWEKAGRRRWEELASWRGGAEDNGKEERLNEAQKDISCF